MPRLRVIKKPADSKDVPLDQAVRVELGAGEVEEDSVIDTGTIPQHDGRTLGIKPEEKTAPARTESGDSGAEAIAAIKKQMEDMKKAHEQALDNERQRVLEADRQRQEALKRAKDNEERLTQAGTRAQQAEQDAITAAIGAATAESETAQRDIEMAMANSDTKLLIDANRRLAGAESDLREFTRNKTAFEARLEREKNQPKREETTQLTGDPVDAHIDSMPSLLPTQKAWLKSHRELMTDNKKNIKLQNAHIDAEESGIRAGSDEYFRFLEERLGYRQPDARNEDDDEVDPMPETNTKPGMVAAPPSRESRDMGTGRVNNNRVTLSPAEREAAKMAGIDELEYAKNKIKLANFKKDGHYSHN